MRDTQASLPSLAGPEREPFLKSRLNFDNVYKSGKKLLSQDRKEVLLKAITLAISMFVMSCFKILKTLCTNMKSLMTKF